MGRAFRDGVSEKNKVKLTAKKRNWMPLADLQGLSGRSRHNEKSMGPLVDVPAMVRIENEQWIFERVSQEVLTHLTHRLVIHEAQGTRTLGATLDLNTAMQVAQRMATKENKIIMIKPL